MDLSISGGQPFALDDLNNFETTSLRPDSDPTWIAFRIGSSFDKEAQLPDFESTLLPSLTPTQLQLPGELEDLPSLESSHGSSAPSIALGSPKSIPLDAPDQDDTGIWNLPDVLSTTRPNKLLSWDTFRDPSHQEPRSAYLSEAGNRGYDLALRLQLAAARQPLPELELQLSDLVSALFELGLGRESRIFVYDEEHKKFAFRAEHLMLSGFSPDTLQHIFLSIQQHGLLIKSIDKSIHLPEMPNTLRTRIALNSVVKTILFGLEQRVLRLKTPATTLLEVSQTFQGSQQLLLEINELIQVVDKAKSDRTTISQAIEFLERASFHDDWTQRILEEIVRRTAAPWLTSVLRSCGIQREKQPGNVSASADEEQPESLLGQAIETLLAEPLSEECRTTYIECTSGRELLRVSEPQHPLLSSTMMNGQLQWEADWDSFERVQAKALSFQHQLEEAISEYGAGNEQSRPNDNAAQLIPTSAPELGQIPSELEDLLAINTLGCPIGTSDPTSSDELLGLIDMRKDSMLQSISLKPALRTSLELSIWPLLTAQNRLVQRSCLHLLFEKHHLSAHLSLQQQYQLFGNGDFVSRLSSALFDPTLSSGERRLARARTTYGTGLRLETRDTWPPATSELRLVLMGLLTESFQSSGLIKSLGSSKNKGIDELPGDLSFSIRDISDTELELCRDAQNIEALDFLCLSYRPNSALQAVITEKSLQKYDRVFKQLLRLLRLQQVTQSMVRDVSKRRAQGRDSLLQEAENMKTRIEMHRFITSLYEYLLGVAVGKHWHIFDIYLRDIESSLRRGDFESMDANKGSIGAIRDFHERTMDLILDSMYLSKKYRQVKELIDKIFRAILKFSFNLRYDSDASPSQKDIANQSQTEFKQLASKLCTFLASQTSPFATRSESSKSKRDYTHDANDRAMAEQLLLRLDFSRYFDDTPLVT